jgi:DNA-binding transcriptional LysR family regulator
MFNAESLSDLDVLDHLELLNSTVVAGRVLGISQSNCSRRYRAFSELLDVDFDRVDGFYRAQRNLDVLDSLRVAAQKLRLRRQLLRISAAWPYGPIDLPLGWHNLTVRSMSTSDLLSLLSGRLLDVWIGGLLECQPLLKVPLSLLTGRSQSLGQTLRCLPLFRWSLVLVAHREHPLTSRTRLTPEDLQACPSPALPIGAAPLLTTALQAQGLANTPYGSSDYELERWEAAARDGRTLSYAPPHRLAELERRFDLVRLPYDLGISDVAAVIGHRDVIGDPAFAGPFKQLSALLRDSHLGRCSEIQWLL